MPASVPLRAASPWQEVHASAVTSAFPFRWPFAGFDGPVGVDRGRMALCAGGGREEVVAMWPVGGIPWQDVQVSSAVLVQMGVAFAPVTPLKVKLPWQ